MTFNASTNAMRCDYCGHTVQLTEQEQNQITEYDLEAALAREPVAEGWGTERRAIKCQNCGAVTTFEPGQVAAKCQFCDSSHVVEEKNRRGVIRPESLLPFSVDKNTALQRFSAWLGRGWFRPGNLKHLASLDQLHGIYLPFWTFDADTSSRWRAQAGYHYYTAERYTTTENGRPVTKTRQVQHTRWVWTAGSHAAFYDDQLVFASGGVNRNQARAIEPFDLKKLVPYRPEYLAGWTAEEYQVDLRQGWNTGKEQIQAKIRAECSRMVPGDTQRFLSVNTTFRKVTFKHVLLPVWVAAYRYGAKLYQCLINGQTGEVQGQAPVSLPKVLLAVLAGIALVAALLYFFGRG
ncbi:MAG: zinc ribbon domain-containing protein [Deinococcus sp.]|nr:zinc ribbon domain-containing protein [Deinococcus sp.]